MKILRLTQGSSGWLEWRSQPHAHNASEASIAAGCNPYTKRGELMRIRAFGGGPEYSRFVQEVILEGGHRVEAKLRPLAEAILGGELYPAVAETDDGFLRASFDGVDMLGDESFEGKSLNESLRAALPVPGLDPDANDAARLPLVYRVQCQQQLMVRGSGERVLFMAGEERGDDVRCCWYRNDPSLAEHIVRVWQQWDEDLAAMLRGETATPPAPSQPAPQEVEALPVVSVRMDGNLAVIDNLDNFGTALRAYIARLPKKPSTDQEFADCDDAVKRLDKAEKALATAEANALASIAEVQAMRAKVASLDKLSSDTRIALGKLVSRRKNEIREEQVNRGRTLLQAHHDGLDRRLGARCMPAPTADFAAAIRNLRKWDNLREAIDTTLAMAKLEANKLADDVLEPNLRTLRAVAPELLPVLFRDRAQLVLKLPEDFEAIVQQRLREHEQAVEAQASRPAATPAPAQPSGYGSGMASREPQPGEPGYNDGSKREEPTYAPTSAPNASNVLPIHQPTPRPTLTAELAMNLGQIKEMIAPLEIGAEGLAAVGFPFVRIEKGAKLYYRADLPAMCDAMIVHLQRVRDSRREAA